MVQLDTKPEMFSGFLAGNGIQHDEYDLRGIVHVHTYRKDNIVMQRRLLQSFTDIYKLGQGTKNFCIDEAQRVLDIFCFAVFLLLDMTITEARKTKVMGKTVIFDFSPYCGSTVKQFLFYKVSRKIANNAMFLETLIDKEIV